MHGQPEELEDFPEVEDDDAVDAPELGEREPEDEEIDRAPQPGSTPAPEEDVSWPR